MSGKRMLLLLCVFATIAVVSSAQAVTYVKLNGATSGTITAGSKVTLTANCTAGGTLIVATAIDVNGNGTYEAATDRLIGPGTIFVDGSPKDEDTTSGVYKESMSGDVGMLAGRKIVVVAFEPASATSAACSATYQFPTTSQGVSGRVTTRTGGPSAGTPVIALKVSNTRLWDVDYPDMAVGLRVARTDSNGNYTLNLSSGGSYLVAPVQSEDTIDVYPFIKQVLVTTGAFASGNDFVLPPAEPTSPADGSAVTTYTVSGTVKDANGKPLPFVQVYADQSTYTDLTGSYSLKMQTGDSYLGLSLNGYVPDADYMVTVSGDTTFNMTMHRGQYKVQGTIKNASGSNALPWIGIDMYQDSFPFCQFTDSGNETGKYLCWLDAGYYTVCAYGLTDRLNSVYYPLDPVSVTGDTTYNFNMLQKNATVTGTVRDGSGNPVPWALVQADNPNTDTGDETLCSYSGSDGTYSLVLTPGELYQVTASKPGYDYDAAYDVSVAANASQTIDFSLPFISHPPVLSNGKVTPVIGSPSNNFVFEVTYTDEDNDAPDYMQVLIDDMNYDMVKADSSDNNYVDGCRYIFTTNMDLGDHYYGFSATSNQNMVVAQTAVGERSYHRGPFVRDNNVPTSDTLSNNSGTIYTGVKTTFAAKYSDADGASDMTNMQLLMNSTYGSSVNSILLKYVVSTNKIYLRDDANATWLGGYAPGSNNVIINGQCKVYCADTTVTTSGNSKIVNWTLHFTESQAGKTLSQYMWVGDTIGATYDWIKMGTIAVATYNAAPTCDSVTPNSGSISVGTKTNFATVYSDGNGAADLKNLQLLMTSTYGSSVNAVRVQYLASTNKMYLMNDAGTGWLGGYAPGASNTIENSQCKIYCADSSTTTSGNSRTINWAIEFKSAVAGQTLGQYMWANDMTAISSDWQTRGSFSVATPSNATPTCDSVTPSSGSVSVGAKTTFTTVFSDGNGAADLKNHQLLMTATYGSSVNAVRVQYLATTNKMYLMNDAGTGWLGGYAPGASNTIENSQCKIYCADSSTTTSGNSRTINWAIEFKSAVAGQTLGQYMWVNDNAGASSNWQTKGSVSVAAPSNSAPTCDSVAPSSGSITVGTKTTFAAVFSDTNGASDLKNHQLLMTATYGSSVNAVRVQYLATTNKIYLMNDAGNGWLGGYTPGASNTIENSQCKVYCADSSTTTNGNSRTVNWAIEFKSAVAGQTLGQYMWVNDNAGASSNWQTKGSVSVTTAVNSTPTSDSVSPNSGSITNGVKTTFTSVFSDANGASDLKNHQLLMTATYGSSANAVRVQYLANLGKIYLMNDAGNGWLGGFAPGSSNVIENSQCKIYCADTDIAVSGNSRTINWAIEFKPSVVGQTLGQYMWVNDMAGVTSNWAAVGSIDVQ